MKKVILLLILVICGQINAQHRHCGSDHKLHEKLKNDPDFRLKREAYLQMQTVKKQSQNRTENNTNFVVTVPVVVHVIYKNATQNISDEQINSQIAMLNEDYRKLNADFTTIVPSAFQPLGADLQIQFVLAKRTSNNLPTTGIVRKMVDESFDFDENYYEAAGSPPWTQSQYLNIWVGRFTNQDLLGFAYTPDSADEPYNGVIVGDEYFGSTGTATFPYNKGRTTTHEVGHYFDLNHPWGIEDGVTGSNCGVGDNSDGVDDTPATSGFYDGCPTFPNNSRTCTFSTNGAMFMNFMDYTNDACMAFFTNGQKTRVRDALNGPRVGLITSLGGTTLGLENYELANSISLYPNPTTSIVSIKSPKINIDSIEIYNNLGQKVKLVNNFDSENSIVISDLSSGMYFVKMYANQDLIKSERLIKY